MQTLLLKLSEVVVGMQGMHAYRQLLDPTIFPRGCYQKLQYLQQQQNNPSVTHNFHISYEFYRPCLEIQMSDREDLTNISNWTY